mmetsp:Transcript_14159/g.23140  ORF Transcript_14159/g.23140 Transcript_14159/m.23140 type:complete len:353 (+) Transcript_14159:378-1436(+)
MGTGKMEFGAKVYSAAAWSAKVATSSGEDWNASNGKGCVRIFVSGDRSQVGKSSCCLGILASLVKNLGYKPSELAYIKPVTQCESVQLITRYCENEGIECVPIGPVVFYSGFTREFLKGNTPTSEELAMQVTEAVESLCAKPGRKIVIIDGVGYPGVGSLVGVSNATAALASNAPVVLICPKGVGNAIDSYNLNSTFFKYHNVPVLGGIFNRFPTTGFYSLTNCKESINSYFEQYQPNAMPYGFLPELQSLVDASPPPKKPNSEEMEVEAPAAGWTKEDSLRIDTLVESFSKHTDVLRLVRDAKLICASGQPSTRGKRLPPAVKGTATKRAKVLSREDIVKNAVARGAAAGA